MLLCKCNKLSNIKILTDSYNFYLIGHSKRNPKVKGILFHQFLNGMFCIFLLKMSFLSERIEIKHLFAFQMEQTSSHGLNWFVYLLVILTKVQESGSSLLRKFQKSQAQKLSLLFLDGGVLHPLQYNDMKTRFIFLLSTV